MSERARPRISKNVNTLDFERSSSKNGPEFVLHSLMKEYALANRETGRFHVIRIAEARHSLFLEFLAVSE